MRRGNDSDWAWNRVGVGHYVWTMGQFRILRDGRRWALVGPDGAVVDKFALITEARRTAREMFEAQVKQ